MNDDYFDEMKEEIYSDNLSSEDKLIEPLNFEDICFFENFSHVCENNNVICTDGLKKYYIGGISYEDDEGFVFNLVKTE